MLTIINLQGVKEAKFVQLVLTLVKTLALFGLIALGFWVGFGKDTFANNWTDIWTTFKTTNTNGILSIEPISGITLLSLMGLAMVGPLFSSSAWNNITYTAAEVKNPKRDIPLSLFDRLRWRQCITRCKSTFQKINLMEYLVWDFLLQRLYK